MYFIYYYLPFLIIPFPLEYLCVMVKLFIVFAYFKFECIVIMSIGQAQLVKHLILIKYFEDRDLD